MTGQRKLREGVVVSDKMDKTVVVAVDRLVRHPKYEKYLRRQVRYKAHDQQNKCACWIFHEITSNAKNSGGGETTLRIEQLICKYKQIS